MENRAIVWRASCRPVTVWDPAETRGIYLRPRSHHPLMIHRFAFDASRRFLLAFVYSPLDECGASTQATNTGRRKRRFSLYPGCFTSLNTRTTGNIREPNKQTPPIPTKNQDASLPVFTLNRWYLNASSIQLPPIIVIVGCTCQK